MHGDGCWGHVFSISGGLACPVVLRVAQTFVQPVLSLARVGVSSKSWPTGLVFGIPGRADLSAVGGDQEVNWRQGEICLLPTTPLYTRLIFLTSSKIFGSEEEESNGFCCSLLLLQFLNPGRGLNFHLTFQTLHIYRYRYKCIGT